MIYLVDSAATGETENPSKLICCEAFVIVLFLFFGFFFLLGVA